MYYKVKHRGESQAGAKVSGAPFPQKELIRPPPSTTCLFQNFPPWGPETLEGKLVGEGITFLNYQNSELSNVN